MIQVILDVNFLMIPFQFKIDIFDEMGRLFGHYRPLILSTNLQELEKLAERIPSRSRRMAISALELAQRCDVLNVMRKSSETNDDVIVRIAEELKCPVATNDAKLRKRLREINIATIFMRDKSHLEIDGYVRNTMTEKTNTSCI